LLTLMDDVPCDYRVYHLVNTLDPFVGHSFIGIEKDGRFLILDPLNCHGNNMFQCIFESTANFYADAGITNKARIIGVQREVYACNYVI
jgi:hypothetical protein